MEEQHEEDYYDDWYTYDEGAEEQQATEEILEAWNTRKILRSGSRFKNLGGKWTDSRLGSKGWIGPCMRQISLAEPESYVEWWNYFMDNTTPNSNARRYTGFERMDRTARAWNHLNPHLSEAEAWNHAVIHAIDETWDGYQTERRIEAALQAVLDRQGLQLEVHRVHPSFDEFYRVDLLVTENTDPETDCMIIGLQVKPLSYFNTNRVPAWQKEATRCAHLVLQHEERVPTAFITEQPRTGELLLWVDEVHKDTGEITYQSRHLSSLLSIPLQVG